MRIRITVPLDPPEMWALARMASDACRHPREQTRHIIRHEAIRMGFLAEAEAPSVPGKVRTEVEDVKP